MNSQWTSSWVSSDLSLHPAPFVASHEKFPWKSLETCSNKSLLGSMSQRSPLLPPLPSIVSPLPYPDPDPNPDAKPDPDPLNPSSEEPLPEFSSFSQSGSCLRRTPSMYHRTLVNVSGFPAETSQKRVTFRLDNSLIGDCGFIRKATVGLSGKVSETNFMKSDNTFIK